VPDSEVKAAEQRALVASFETLEKAEDDTNKVLQQRLLQDTATHRALATGRRMDQWAAKQLRREGGNDGAGRQPPRGATTSVGPCSFLFFLYFVCTLCISVE
jgi:hypothetical protein